MNLSLYLISCAGTVERPHLFGKYHLQSSTLDVWLELKPDGTFEQRIEQSTNSGTWEWESDLGMLVLNNAIDVRDGKRVREWIIALHVVKGFRSLRLEINPNGEDAYVKQ